MSSEQEIIETIVQRMKDGEARDYEFHMYWLEDILDCAVDVNDKNEIQKRINCIKEAFAIYDNSK